MVLRYRPRRRPRPPNPFSEIVGHFSLFDSQFFAVQEVAIVGMPDERWGEAPHAFVVLKAGGHFQNSDEF